jgi:hypothetical protein
LLATNLHAYWHGFKPRKLLFVVVGATKQLSSCPTQLGQRNSRLLHLTLRSFPWKSVSRRRVDLLGSAKMPLWLSGIP